MTNQHDFNKRLSFAAHELITPLTLIRFYAEAIKESTPEESQRFADNIMVLSQDLTQSSRLLLSAAKTQQEGCEGPKALNLKNELNRILSTMQPLLKQNNITFVNQVPASAKTNVCYAGLKIILTNLISNALKFSPSGSRIIFSIDPQKNALCVSDQAPCIPKSEHLKIFEPFTKSSNTNKNTASFGLGLYICQHITNLWQQKIWVQTNPQKNGNQFCFTLPQ